MIKLKELLTLTRKYLFDRNFLIKLFGSDRLKKWLSRGMPDRDSNAAAIKIAKALGISLDLYWKRNLDYHFDWLIHQTDTHKGFLKHVNYN